MKLVLIRHGESKWNKENRFTGWTDVDLTETGRREAADSGQVLKEKEFDFDVCYTSYLKRAINTLNIILNELDRQWLPVIKTWKLNERHYGALQGLNKAETAAKYGDEQVKLWRRSFDIQPPSLNADDERNPAFSAQYRAEKDAIFPLTESLKDTIGRTIPYFEQVIRPDMLDGKRVLIVAHGNSLRALIKYFEGLSEDEIVEVNIPTGIPLVYKFDEKFNFVKKYYLGNDDVIAEKVNGVANQARSNRGEINGNQ